MRVLSILAIVAGVALSGAASASTTFTFDSAGPQAESADYTIGGISLTVSADLFRNSNNTLRNAANILVTFHNDGLGVKNNNGNSDPSHPGQVDGENNNDVLIFDFNQAVRLMSITFNRVDNNDNYTFFAGDPLSVQTVNANLPNGNSTASRSFNVLGDQFGIGAKQNNDEFRIASVTVSAVPEPATWLMMLAGFALTGFALKRRRGVAVAA